MVHLQRPSVVQKGHKFASAVQGVGVFIFEKAAVVHVFGPKPESTEVKTVASQFVFAIVLIELSTVLRKSFC